MEIRCLGSSSRGNCYILKGEKESLIIEAGVPFFDIKKALNFDFSQVVGAIVSHKHGDHAKSVVNLIQTGIKTVSTAETFERNSTFAIVGQDRKGLKIGNFKIIPLAVKHDCDCFGYLINHPECGSLGFFTDTYEIPYKLPPLDWLMIEANYSKSLIDERFYAGTLCGAARERIIRSHNSFESALAKIKEQKDLRGVILIHLSDSNSDMKEFQSKTEKSTGFPTYCAESGFILRLTA